jgi:thioredoxin-dependent peroxiredoxin
MMKLKKGDAAIHFELIDVFGRPISLKKYQGKRILLSFFRNTACPFCNLRIHQLSKWQPEWSKKNFEMIFFLESKKEVILRSALHKGVSPIPLLSDPEKKWFAEYGIEHSWLKMIKTAFTQNYSATVKEAEKRGIEMVKDTESPMNTMPADFLIDEQLIIQDLRYGQLANDHIPIEIIKQFIGTK